MKNDSPDILLEAVGRRIRVRRLQQGLTQDAFAQRAGFLKQYAYRVEAGQQNLSLRTLHRIATALETSIAGLLEGVEADTPYPRGGGCKNESEK